MSWQYSDPLNGALLAAHKPTTLNSSDPNAFSTITPFYQPSYSPPAALFSRYQPPSTNFNHHYKRQPASINIFDDIDDFDLEVDTDDILNSARYRVTTNNAAHRPQPTAYIPSYFNAASNATDTEYKNQLSNRSLNIDSTYKVPMHAGLSPNPYQNAFRPMPFDRRSTPPSSFKSDNSYQHSVINSSDPNNHNNHHQRFIQYQHRMMQDKDESLGELEDLKFKQKQDRRQLLDAMQHQNNNNNNFSSQQLFQQPNYQEHHIIKKQYSEASIPSTNADPLYSNSPTPPLMNHKLMQQQMTYRPNNNNNNNNENNTKASLNKDLKDARSKKQYHTIKDKYTGSDYRQYQKNFGFGQQFLPFDAETKQDKIEKTKKREEYSRRIKEQNLSHISKNMNNNNGQLLMQNSKSTSNSNNNIFFNSNEPLPNRRINELRNGNFKGKEATRAK